MKQPQAIFGMTVVRNEADIIQDSLDHLAEFCNGIYVHDDASTDETASICRAHPAVRDVLETEQWDTNWPNAEMRYRNAVLERAKQDADPGDWLVYVDGDERIEFDWSRLGRGNYHGVVMRLYDFYITAEDVDKRYDEREWIGPEYRSILMVFQAGVAVGYFGDYIREVTIADGCHVLCAGSVRHYGKARSVERWEKKCAFYEKFYPAFAAKWRARKGKAVHTMSDFGRPLIKWEDRVKYEVPL
jgi:glycosyltransferase involved in cell wall biosynthesis